MTLDNPRPVTEETLRDGRLPEGGRLRPHPIDVLPNAGPAWRRRDACAGCVAGGLARSIGYERFPNRQSSSWRGRPEGPPSDNGVLQCYSGDASVRKAANKTKPLAVANDSDDLKGTLKNIGGSPSDHWNNILALPTVQALWLNNIAQPSRR
jgi:hypothetical protein